MPRLVIPFEVTRRDMTSYGEDGTSGDSRSPRLARATFYQKYGGELEAEGEAEALLCQADPKDLSAGAGYVVSERVVGSLAGRKGSFVIQHWGVSGGGKPNHAAGHVVPGSGTGELSGLTGTAEIQVGGETEHTLGLDYDVPPRS